MVDLPRLDQQTRCQWVREQDAEANRSGNPVGFDNAASNTRSSVRDCR